MYATVMMMTMITSEPINLCTLWEIMYFSFELLLLCQVEDRKLLPNFSQEVDIKFRIRLYFSNELRIHLQ